MRALLVGTVDSDVRLSGQDPIEFVQGSGHTAAQILNKLVGLHRKTALLIVGDTAVGVIPVSRQIVIGVAEGMGSFHPDLLALEGTLKLLQHTQLVIVAVDPGFAVDVFEDVLGPAAGNNPLDGNK